MANLDMERAVAALTRPTLDDLRAELVFRHVAARRRVGVPFDADTYRDFRADGLSARQVDLALSQLADAGRIVLSARSGSVHAVVAEAGA